MMMPFIDSPEAYDGTIVTTREVIADVDGRLPTDVMITLPDFSNAHIRANPPAPRRTVTKVYRLHKERWSPEVNTPLRLWYAREFP